MLPWVSNWDRTIQATIHLKTRLRITVKHLQLLSNYAQDDPQATYSAFTKG